jgi:WD40 repeat protein
MPDGSGLCPFTGKTVGLITRGVAFSPDGKLLATADSHGNVQPWNPATDQPVSPSFPAAPGRSVTAMAFSQDGKLLATAESDGSVRPWPLFIFTNPYTALCADVGPPTEANWTKYAPDEQRPKFCS